MPEKEYQTELSHDTVTEDSEQTLINSELASIKREILRMQNSSGPHSEIHLAILNCECRAKAAKTSAEELATYKEYQDILYEIYDSDAREWDLITYPECRGE